MDIRTIQETLEPVISFLQRVIGIGYCLVPVLFGLFMIFWGIIINRGDWVLIIMGLFIILLFGRSLCRLVLGR